MFLPAFKKTLWLDALQPRMQAKRRVLVLTETALFQEYASIKECFPVQGLKTTWHLFGAVWQMLKMHQSYSSSKRAVLRLWEIECSASNVLHETTNPVWGQTNHPETKARSPGGSSGGDAALVAAGVVPLGVGNDLAEVSVSSCVRCAVSSS